MEQFLKDKFERWPALHNLMLTILLMASSKRDLERLMGHLTRHFHLTREDFRDLENVWESFFKKHRPSLSWTSDGNDVRLLLSMLLPLPALEVSGYYLARATQHKQLPDDTDDCSLTSYMISGALLLPKIKIAGRETRLWGCYVYSKGGAPDHILTAFELHTPIFGSLDAAKNFAGLFGEDTDLLAEIPWTGNTSLLRPYWKIRGRDLGRLMRTLEDRQGPGERYHIKPGSRFFQTLVGILVKRGLVLDEAPTKKVGSSRRS